MKKILFYLITTVFIISLIACSTKSPSFRVFNERTTKANVQIKTTTNTINQNDVSPGNTTTFQDIPEGSVEVTATIQSESVSPTVTFFASNDNNYTIVIVNSNPPTLRVDTSDK